MLWKDQLAEWKEEWMEESRAEGLAEGRKEKDAAVLSNAVMAVKVLKNSPEKVAEAFGIDLKILKLELEK